MKLSTCVFIVQGATSTSRLTRDFALHRVRSAQLTLEEVVKQIPSANRALRTIQNFQAILQQWQARAARRAGNDSETQIQANVVTEDFPLLAGNKENFQERVMSENFSDTCLGMPWSYSEQVDFAVFPEFFPFDAFDWRPETDGIS